MDITTSSTPSDFDHVDVGKPHCPKSGNTNAKVCYGVNEWDKNSLMGGGVNVRHEHAIPWRRATIELTGHGDISKPSDWPAIMLPIYPRTVAEADAGKVWTTRPMR